MVLSDALTGASASMHRAAADGSIAGRHASIEGKEGVVSATAAETATEGARLLVAADAGDSEMVRDILGDYAVLGLRMGGGWIGSVGHAPQCNDPELWDLAVSVLPDAATGLGSFTALHYAAARGHEGVARLLLSAGASVEARTADGETAMHLACDGGHDGVVQLLLDFGARTDAKSRSSLDETPLFSASRGSSDGHERCV